MGRGDIFYIAAREGLDNPFERSISISGLGDANGPCDRFKPENLFHKAVVAANFR